nr:hypothetical protein Iba_chr09cCG9510 [Ipomoea batatas]
MADLVKTVVHETYNHQMSPLVCFLHLAGVVHSSLRHPLVPKSRTQAVLHHAETGMKQMYHFYGSSMSFSISVSVVVISLIVVISPSGTRRVSVPCSHFLKQKDDLAGPSQGKWPCIYVGGTITGEGYTKDSKTEAAPLRVPVSGGMLHKGSIVTNGTGGPEHAKKQQTEILGLVLLIQCSLNSIPENAGSTMGIFVGTNPGTLRSLYPMEVRKEGEMGNGS